MSTVKNKIVFITGATSGIGLELARAFAKEGAKVVAVGRRSDRLQILLNELVDAGYSALTMTCDVNNETDLQRVIAETQTHFGAIDIVIANAGYGVSENFFNLSVADFRRQFETNIFGLLNTCYATLNDLTKTKGQLVLIGSLAAYISVPKSAPYSMSKAAVRALADTLYAELAPLGITVTLISPGFITTEINHIDNLGHYCEQEKRHTAPAWLKMPANKAAKEIIKAIRHKKREKIITGHGKFFALINTIFPRCLPRLFKKIIQYKLNLPN